MQPLQCNQCVYFHQHYILDSQRCATVHCAHCVQPRLKHRKPDSPACPHFELCTDRDLPDRSRVISYLTTDFLQELLRLHLPPQINEE